MMTSGTGTAGAAAGNAVIPAVSQPTHQVFRHLAMRLHFLISLSVVVNLKSSQPSRHG